MHLCLFKFVINFCIGRYEIIWNEYNITIIKTSLKKKNCFLDLNENKNKIIIQIY